MAACGFVLQVTWDNPRALDGEQRFLVARRSRYSKLLKTNQPTLCVLARRCLQQTKLEVTSQRTKELDYGPHKDAPVQTLPPAPHRVGNTGSFRGNHHSAPWQRRPLRVPAGNRPPRGGAKRSFKYCRGSFACRQHGRPGDWPAPRQPWRPAPVPAEGAGPEGRGEGTRA